MLVVHSRSGGTPSTSDRPLYVVFNVVTRRSILTSESYESGDGTINGDHGDYIWYHKTKVACNVYTLNNDT